MLTVAVANQKGGVGKTTTVLGLASAARHRGLSVLIIDLDPQANCTTTLGVSTEDGPTASDVLQANRKGCATDAIWDTSWGEHISLIPSSLSLAERDADTALGAELRLRKALDSPDLSARFDLCLIDCPPSIGRLVSNALIAATTVLVVTEPSFMASQGVAKIVDSVHTVRDNYHAALEVAGVVINRVPARSREATYRTTEIREALGDLVWTPHMPTRTALAEATGNGTPIHDHTPKANDCIAAFNIYLDRLLEHSTAKKEN